MVYYSVFNAFAVEMRNRANETGIGYIRCGLENWDKLTCSIQYGVFNEAYIS